MIDALKKQRSLGISLLLHALLFALLIVHFTDHTTYKIPGKIHLVQAYLINSPQQTHKQPTKPTKKQGYMMHEREKQTPHHHAQLAQNKAITGKELNQLVIILYESINQHSHMPAIASALHQSGKVTIEFTLLPNGKIMDTHILKSSGYHSLDSAALQATKAAEPIPQAKRYLQHPQQFDVPIMYQN